jgi:hypothetical protein
MTLQTTPPRAIFMRTHSRSGGTSVVDRGGAVLLGQRQDTQDASVHPLRLAGYI